MRNQQVVAASNDLERYNRDQTDDIEIFEDSSYSEAANQTQNKMDIIRNQLTKTPKRTSKFKKKQNSRTPN
jgi:hypothetical protein